MRYGCIYVRIEWDEANIRHLEEDNGARQITRVEVEQVLTDPASGLRRGRGGSLFVSGRTAGGRRLTVVVERRGRGAIRPITAWEKQ